MAQVDSVRAAALLREHRRAAGLSQRRLAELAQVSIGVVRDLEQCRTARLRGESVRRLAGALKLDQGRALEFARATGPCQDTCRPENPALVLAQDSGSRYSGR